MITRAGGASVINSELLANLVWEDAGVSWGETNAAELEGFIFDLVQSKGYYWDKRKAQYISKWNSKPVLETTVRSAVESFNSSFVGENITNITNQFIDGGIKLPEWQRRVALELKHGHVINLSVGKGGRANTTFSDWGKTGSNLKFQYQRLNLLAEEIKAGGMSDAQIRARINMYSNSVRTSYFEGLTRANVEAGNQEERRQTTSAEPCEVCDQLQQRGWQPIGTLPNPGEECYGFTNCKCYKEYRTKGGTR